MNVPQTDLGAGNGIEEKKKNGRREYIDLGMKLTT